MPVALMLGGEALALIMVVCVIAWVGGAGSTPPLTDQTLRGLIRAEYPDFTPDTAWITQDRRAALIQGAGQGWCVVFRLGAHWVVWVLPDRALDLERDRGVILVRTGNVTRPRLKLRFDGSTLNAVGDRIGTAQTRARRRQNDASLVL